jgi:DNA-binding NtrC family response regulator
MDEASEQLPRVLIVDNHVVFANVLRTTLAMRGFVCGVAHSLAAATEAIDFNTFDVVISDYHLDDGSGLDVLREVKERAPEVVTILMTGSITPDGYEEFRRAMPHATIQKPFAVDALRDLIQQKLAAKRR